MEHRNEKILTETRHKLNLNKAENEKTVELNTIIRTYAYNIRKSRQIDSASRPRPPRSTRLSKEVHISKQRVQSLQLTTNPRPIKMRSSFTKLDEIQCTDTRRAVEIFT